MIITSTNYFLPYSNSQDNMNYIIEEVNIEDEKIIRPINRLLEEVFGFAAFADNKLKLNTGTKGTQPSLYLAAIEDGEIIGFNAFISHTFFLNNKPIISYQSCWTATSKNHRGKKIFQNIIEEAKKILKARNAAFIFGYPNVNSHPIFIHKLKFIEYPSVKLNIPNLSFLWDLFLNNHLPNVEDLKKDAILQNDKELFALKKGEYGDKIIKAAVNNSFIWGIIRHKILKGIKLAYFSIGGMEISDVNDVKQLLKKLSQDNKFYYFQFVSAQSNTWCHLFRRLTPAKTEDLIIYDLNVDSSQYHYNFFGGVKDVF